MAIFQHYPHLKRCLLLCETELSDLHICKRLCVAAGGGRPSEGLDKYFSFFDTKVQGDMTGSRRQAELSSFVGQTSDVLSSFGSFKGIRANQTTTLREGGPFGVSTGHPQTPSSQHKDVLPEGASGGGGLQRQPASSGGKPASRKQASYEKWVFRGGRGESVLG